MERGRHLSLEIRKHPFKGVRLEARYIDPIEVSESTNIARVCLEVMFARDGGDREATPLPASYCETS